MTAQIIAFPVENINRLFAAQVVVRARELAANRSEQTIMDAFEEAHGAIARAEAEGFYEDIRNPKF